MAARGGVVNQNDLVWIVRVPNVAAKLNALKESPYHSLIIPTVYRAMYDNVRYGPGGELLWSKRTWNEVEGMKEMGIMYLTNPSWRRMGRV